MGFCQSLNCWLWCVSAISSYLFLCSPAQARAPEDFDRYVDRVMQEWHVPGMAVAVVRNNRVLFAKGYGLRKLGGQDLVTEETIFGIASLTKSFTAGCVGSLVDARKLKWDNKVIRYIPKFQLSDHRFSDTITIRDLLTQRGNLGDSDRLWLYTEFPPDEIIRRLRYEKASCSGQKRYYYQSTPYLVAAKCACIVTKSDWDTLLHKQILIPLRMTCTNTSIAALSSLKNVASPHRRIAGKLSPIEYCNYDNIGPAGSMNSNVLELSNWMLMLLNDGLYEGKRVINETTVKEILRPQTFIHRDAKTGFTEWYAMGWQVDEFKELRFIHHGGAIPGMQSEMCLSPSNKLGIVVLANVDSTEGGVAVAVVNELMSMLLNWKNFDPNEMIKKQTRIEKLERSTFTKSLAEWSHADKRRQEPLKKHVGKYSNMEFGLVQITMLGDHLELSLNGTSLGPLVHCSGETFAIKPRPKFNSDDDICLRFLVDQHQSVYGVWFGNLGMFKSQR